MNNLNFQHQQAVVMGFKTPPPSPQHKMPIPILLFFHDCVKKHKNITKNTNLIKEHRKKKNYLCIKNTDEPSLQ